MSETNESYDQLMDRCRRAERRIGALESEKAALEIRAKELEVDAETWRTVHRRQLNRAEQAEADLAAFEAAMAEARTEIESDPRYRPDDPAQVQVNAPLALIQVGMESKIMLLNFLKRAAGRESGGTNPEASPAGNTAPSRGSGDRGQPSGSGQKSAAALQKVFNVAAKLSGIGEKDIEELTDGLEKDPFDGLPSD